MAADAPPSAVDIARAVAEWRLEQKRQERDECMRACPGVVFFVLVVLVIVCAMERIVALRANYATEFSVTPEADSKQQFVNVWGEAWDPKGFYLEDMTVTYNDMVFRATRKLYPIGSGEYYADPLHNNRKPITDLMHQQLDRVCEGRDRAECEASNTAIMNVLTLYSARVRPDYYAWELTFIPNGY